MALTQGTQTVTVNGYYDYIGARDGWNGVKVREGPGTGYAQLGKFPDYTQTSSVIRVEVEKVQNGWIKHLGSSTWGVPAGWSVIVSGGTYFSKVEDPYDYEETIYTGTAYAYFYYPDSGSSTYKKQSTKTRYSDPEYQLLSAPSNNTVSSQKTDIVLTINPDNGTGTTSQTGKTWTDTTYQFTGWDEKTSASAPDSLISGSSDYPASEWMWSLSDLHYYADYKAISTSDPQYSNNTINLITPEKTKEISTYTVNFDPNGGSVSTTSTSVTKTTTYEFSGWTSSTGIAISGTTCTFRQNGTITANYTSTTTPAKVSSMPTPTKPGYEFLGWGISSTQTDNLIPGGDPSPEINDDITYIAIWDTKGTIRIYVEEDKKYRMALPYLHDGTKWRLTVPYLHNGTRYYIIAG